MPLDLYAVALSLYTAVWPAQAKANPEIEDFARASVVAVAGDPYGPALGSDIEDLKAMAMNAFLESGLHAHAAGDCHDRMTGRPVAPALGFARAEDVPKGVVCASHGGWQQAGSWGKGELVVQAIAWLDLLHKSVRENAAHPLAWLLSGSPNRGTKLSDYRMRRARRTFAGVVPQELALTH